MSAADVAEGVGTQERRHRSLPLARLPVALRLAVREMRGGLSGFAIFLACLAVGVASIAGVGSLAGAMQDGLAREGRSILGGDLGLSLIHRELSPETLTELDGLGDVARFATLTGMARTDAGESATVSVKAVDGAYPLAGTLALEGGGALDDALRGDGTLPGLVADPLLASRLGLSLGDRISLGEQAFRLAGLIETEPDRLGTGFGFGPRVMFALDRLADTGLVQPGSLIRYQARVALDDPSDANLAAIEADLEGRTPEMGWRVSTRDNASPRLARQIESFGQFLVLVGLTALVVGGVGVANAVRAYMDGKREVVATLKSLGAPAGTVFTAYLAQILLMALVGIVIGLAVGASLPGLIDLAFGDLLPARLAGGLYPGALVLAAAFGILTALTFAILPLARARRTPAQALFRGRAEGAGLGWRDVVLAGGSAFTLGALAVLLSEDRLLALGYLGGAVAVFAVLRLLAWGIMAAAQRLPRPRGVASRMALASIHRPNALTPTVVLSMGLGLALLVSLALIDTAMRRQIAEILPAEAPSFFFLDVQRDQTPAFLALLESEAPEASVETSPQLRGRVVSLAGVPREEIQATPDTEWAIRGDRGITYADTIPDGDRIVSGEWWPADYAGEPLVSFDSEIAEGVGLAVGDEVTVNVLGREITARLANTREVEWESLGINFVMVFSPNTFAGAPHGVLATLAYPDGGDAAREGALLRQIGRQFPTVTAVRVKEALETVNDIVGRLAWAIRGASGVTLLVSVLVLAGALSAAHRHRIREATILKTLGASRARLLLTYSLEYAVLGAVTAVFGVGLGMLAAWVVTTQVIDIAFVPAPAIALGVAVGAVLATVLLGLIGTGRALGHKPASVLRAL